MAKFLVELFLLTWLYDEYQPNVLLHVSCLPPESGIVYRPSNVYSVVASCRCWSTLEPARENLRGRAPIAMPIAVCTMKRDCSAPAIEADFVVALIVTRELYDD